MNRGSAGGVGRRGRRLMGEPTNVGTRTGSPEVEKNLAGLMQRDYYGLCICEIANVVCEHAVCQCEYIGVTSGGYRGQSTRNGELYWTRRGPPI